MSLPETPQKKSSLVVDSAFREAQSLLSQFATDREVRAAIGDLIEMLVVCFSTGRKVLIAGNGGSMADAMHFAEEWTGRFRHNRRPYPALAIGDPTHLTCVGNDYGFEHVFSRPIEAFAKRGDVVILLTTSGDSPNLLEGAEAAHNAGATVVGLLGRGGGQLRPMCDLAVIAPGTGSDRIQELHMLTLHAVIDAVEQRLAE